MSGGGKFDHFLFIFEFIYSGFLAVCLLNRPIYVMIKEVQGGNRVSFWSSSHIGGHIIMEVSYCTFRFGTVNGRDLRTLSLPCDSQRNIHYARVIKSMQKRQLTLA